MTIKSESGHARNVAAFMNLISFCESFGSTYNPAVSALQIISLKTKLQDAEAAMANCQTKQIALNKAVDARRTAYDQLRSISQRAMASLQISGVSKENLATANTIYRKLQGRRAGGKTEALPPGDEQAEEQSKNISVSQQSFVNQAAFFGNFIELLATMPEYQPNETDLQTATMQTFLAQLQTLNKAVLVSNAEASNSRKDRNQVMYADANGMLDIALATKKYIKAAYGQGSAEQGQVNPIEFKRLKNS